MWNFKKMNNEDDIINAIKEFKELYEKKIILTMSTYIICIKINILKIQILRY